METILFDNREKNTIYIDNLYYPRIQVNKRGEIILALSKRVNDGLTKGFLIGLTPESKSKLKMGSKFDDWEVVGELEDYSEPMTVTMKNTF